MKILKKLALVLTISSFGFITSCSNDDDNTNMIDESINNLSQEDKDGLLFMLEEEKLARDTYQFLDNTWSINIFGNIKISEQTHMDLVANLLTQYNVSYSILPEGEFVNQDLQNYYNQFVIDGQTSLINALKIGATIEDLDIVDLEDYISATDNTSIIDVYENLQCGSRNHLKSYVAKIIENGGIYTPQFLSEDNFNLIINGSHENCN